MDNATKVSIDKAEKKDLLWFANNVLGLDVHPNSGEETLRAKVREAHGRDDITIPAAQQSTALQSGSTPTSAKKESKKGMVRILLHKSEEEDGEEHVPVGVNGKVMLIPRGEPVEIPKAYFEVLSHSTRVIYQVDQKTGRMTGKTREIQSYPFMVL